jgi:hypothetical protein
LRRTFCRHNIGCHSEGEVPGGRYPASVGARLHARRRPIPATQGVQSPGPQQPRWVSALFFACFFRNLLAPPPRPSKSEVVKKEVVNNGFLVSFTRRPRAAHASSSRPTDEGRWTDGHCRSNGQLTLHCHSGSSRLRANTAAQVPWREARSTRSEPEHVRAQARPRSLAVGPEPV